MNKFKYLGVLITTILLSSCITNVMTGANIIYDRHQVYKKSTDIALSAKVGHAIKLEPELNCPSNKCFEIAVFHSDVLLLGTVTSEEEKDKATEVVQGVGGYRHFYNYIQVNPNYQYVGNWMDHWITTEIRTKVMANADIDPNPFKIISHEEIVYILGDVMDYQEALITDICRKTDHVKKVVNLMQSYSLKKHKRQNTPPIKASPELPNTNSW